MFRVITILQILSAKWYWWYTCYYWHMSPLGWPFWWLEQKSVSFSFNMPFFCNLFIQDAKRTHTWASASTSVTPRCPQQPGLVFRSEPRSEISTGSPTSAAGTQAPELLLLPCRIHISRTLELKARVRCRIQHSDTGCGHPIQHLTCWALLLPQRWGFVCFVFPLLSENFNF